MGTDSQTKAALIGAAAGCALQWLFAVSAGQDHTGLAYLFAATIGAWIGSRFG